MLGDKTQKVLDYITVHGSITTEEARNDLGITNLSSVVIPCLKRHVPIRSEWVDGKKPNGNPTKMCRYYIDGFLWAENDEKVNELSEREKELLAENIKLKGMLLKEEDFLKFEYDDEAREKSETEIKQEYLTLKKAEAWDKLMWQIEVLQLLVDADAFKMTNGTHGIEYFLKIIEKIKTDGGLTDEINEKK